MSVTAASIRFRMPLPDGIRVSAPRLQLHHDQVGSSPNQEPWFLEFQVENQGQQWLSLVQVEVYYFDREGELVDFDIDFADGYLAPGRTHDSSLSVGSIDDAAGAEIAVKVEVYQLLRIIKYELLLVLVLLFLGLGLPLLFGALG